MIRRRKSFKSTISMLLVLSTILTCSPNIVIANADTSGSSEITKLTTDEKQGVILHAWNWSFNTVKDNLDDIAAAGYTAIQVSPIQVNKDINGEYTATNRWWILYQPAGFRIGNEQLGSEEEFKQMCAAAHEKGIKIIVDTIVNHMGNNGDPNIPADEVDAELSFAEHPDFWHIDENGKLNVISDYNNRYDVTHNGVGLPDLNTANEDLQAIIKAYLQHVLDAGADGFRFDTAKHVELPTDSEDVRSDFWPSVLDGLTLSAESTALADGDNKPYVYGEVLQGGADELDDYAKLFDTTASKYGHDIRNTVGVGAGEGTNLSKNFDGIKDYGVPAGVESSDLVTWVESHDTYANDSEESTAMTDEQIENGWGIVAARADSTPLYFNRPEGRKKLQGNMGDVGSDSWKDPDVIAVNKFHTAMDGQDERLTKLTDNVIMIERGTANDATKKGVVIVNLGSEPFALSDQAINLDNSTYNNCATNGGVFTVSDGKISGTASKGITVLYAGGTQEAPVITPKVSIDKEDCSFTGTLELTLNVTSAASAAYSIDGVDQGSFANGDKITIGENVAPGTKMTVKVSATSETGKEVSEIYTYMKRNPDAKATVYFTKPDGWQAPYAYVYNTLGEKYNEKAWPGTKMEKIGANLYKFEITGFTEGEVVFNDWFYGSHQTEALALSDNDMKLYDANKTWTNTPEISKDPNVEDDEVAEGTSKVYFEKPDTADWNYEDVCIYFYGKGGPSWPGVPMTKVEGSTNLYTYTLPAGLEGSNVIFNTNGGRMQMPGSGESGLTAPANSSMILANGEWKEYTKGTSKAYFRKPADWAEPNVYAFTNTGGFKEVSGWPGVKMTKVSGTETLYSYTLPENFGDATIIFNDKVSGSDAGNQTVNLELPFETAMIYDEETKSLREFTADDLEEPEAPAVAGQGVTKVYFKNTFGWEKVKIHYWQEGGTSTAWPGVSMVDEGNNLYSYNLPKGYESAKIIFNNDGKGQQTVNLSTKVGSTMEFVSTGELDGENHLTGELVSKSKVYFKNTEGWTSVKIHYWQDGGSSTTWPGESMVNEGDNLYSYTMPEGYENANLIFNNNNKGKQTNDLKAEDEKTLIYIDGEWREFTEDDVPKGDTEEPTNPDDTEQPTEVSKTPTVTNTIYTTTTTVKGKAGANADIVLSIDEEIKYTTSAGAKVVTETKVLKKEIGSTTADKNGNWLVKISKQKKGTKIKVTGKEEGKSEAATTVTVKKKSSSSSSSSSGYSSSDRKETVSVNGNTTIINSTDAAVIAKEILNSTTTSITINLASKPIAYKEIFEALLNNPNKTITLVGNNVSWTFNGADIAVDRVEDIDITIKPDSQNAAMINNLVGGKEVVNLSFAHKGLLPGKAKIQVKVDTKYNNKVMYMYSYNVANNRLTLVSANVIINDGAATFEVTKGSDYILSETPVAGAVKEGWNQTSNGNWIFVKDENNATGWIKDGTNWYLTDKSGIMKTGWAKDIDGKWYYLNNSGAMKTGWLNDNGTWYYLSQSGAMLSSTVVDGYVLGADGAWIA